MTGNIMTRRTTTILLAGAMLLASGLGCSLRQSLAQRFAVEPTETPAPTKTPRPTFTPTPSFPFYVADQSNREFTRTNNPVIIIYVEILDANGTPLGGYRVIGDSTTGQHWESGESCWEWCKTTGTGGYAKVANVTFEPGPFIDGAWNIYLVDGAGNQVSPVVSFPYSTDPNQWVWDHILFKKK